MKTQTNAVQVLNGLDERQPAPDNSLSVITNWRADSNGGWFNNLGYERYFTDQNDWTPFELLKIDSLFYFEKHDGALDSIVYEQGGTLYRLGEATSPPEAREIEANRNSPNPTELGTQYAQFGKFLIFCNGYNPPKKLIGKTVTGQASADSIITYPLGFIRTPSAPSAWGVEVDPTRASVAGDNISITLNKVSASGKGLGNPTSGEGNKYKWKVSFINNAGCESPLSVASETITWTTDANEYKYVLALNIPTGDNDVVARRIYRTINLEGQTSEIYYRVADIRNNHEEIFFDDFDDLDLGAEAPAATDSIVFPSFKCRFVANYKSCLFVDGGVEEDSTIYWSNPSRLDQFSALDFLDLRNTEGGGITGFYSYFGFMLIFRERAIDILAGQYPSFQVTNLIQYVGTRAINTVTSIPNVGIIFLGNDGIYLVVGNPEYGVPEIKKISTNIQETIDRINVDCIAKSSAAYSHKWREWICFVPVDGEVENSIGIVLHLDNNQWSIREQFPAGPVITNKQGDIIFGNNIDVAAAADPKGLWVMSARHTLGSTVSGDQHIDVIGLVSKMASQWLDFGDPSTKKRILSVYLTMRTKGNNTVSLTGYKDYQYNNPTTTKARTTQISDVVKQSVYDEVKTDDNKFWEEPLITTVRYDLDIRKCSHFRWEIETQNECAIIGYFIDYEISGQRILEGRAT